MKKEYTAKFEQVKKAINRCIPCHIWRWNANGKTLDEKMENFTTAEEVWQELYKMAETDNEVFRTISRAEWWVIEAVSRIVKRNNIDCQYNIG